MNKAIPVCDNLNKQNMCVFMYLVQTGELRGVSDLMRRSQEPGYFAGFPSTLHHSYGEVIIGLLNILFPRERKS